MVRCERCRVEAVANAASLALCATHLPLGVEADKGGRRQCPYDPAHVVWTKRFARHCRRCPSRPGAAGEGTEKEAKRPHPRPDDPRSFPAKRTRRAAEMEEGAVRALHARVRAALEAAGAGAPPPEEDLRHESFAGEATAATSGRSAKHARQESSLIEHAVRAGMAEGDPVWIEFGAGTARLSHHLQRAMGGRSDHVLLERVRFRGRSLHDKAMAAAAAAAGRSVRRVEADIRDASVDDLVTGDRPAAIIGKHLCGPATDLTLACAAAGAGRCHVAVATCCHHLTSAGGYVNSPFLRAAGLSADDERDVASLTAWATVAGGGWRRGVGLDCRDLLDVGRARWLEERGYRCRLVRYTRETCENTLLLAVDERSREAEASV